MAKDDPERRTRAQIPDPKTPGQNTPRQKKGLSGRRKAALVAILAVLALSVLARLFTPDPEPAPSATGPGAASLVAGGEGAAAEPEAGPIATALPYVTEGSFFALIGFALGYASRKLLKIGLVVLGVFFVALQGLSYADVIQIDWTRAIELVNEFILNLNENDTFGEILADRLPSVGSLGAGYLLGLRKG